jgi:hypothetical protein
MRKIVIAICISLVAAAGILQIPRAAHADLAVDFTIDVAANGLVENGGPTTFGASTGFTTVGWMFTPTVDLYLTRLGVYDADRDRFHSEAHQVAIWAANNPSLPLASVTISEGPTNHVPETSPNGALFHFENLTVPYLLSRGETYIVGATLYAGLVNGTSTTDFDSFAAFNQGDSPIFISPYLTYLGNAYGINTANSLIFPTSTLSGLDYTIGANMDVTPVPLPGAFWMFGSGLVGLYRAGRKLIS